MKTLKNFIKESLDQNIINEHFITLFKKKEMEEYGDEVWDMIQKSYAYIGGLAGVDSVKDLIADTDLWKLVRRDNKITAVKIYKMKNGGRKANACATDGTDQGAKDVKMIYKEDGLMKDRKSYGEYSGKAVSVVLKTGGIPIPAAIAKEVLVGKEIEPCEDGWFYVRKLGDGNMHHKLMVGNLPGDKYDAERPSPELIDQLKALARAYYVKDEQDHK